MDDKEIVNRHCILNGSVSHWCMSYVMRKPVFGVCGKVRLKLACSATESS